MSGICSAHGVFQDIGDQCPRCAPPAASPAGGRELTEEQLAMCAAFGPLPSLAAAEIVALRAVAAHHRAEASEAKRSEGVAWGQAKHWQDRAERAEAALRELDEAATKVVEQYDRGALSSDRPGATHAVEALRALSGAPLPRGADQ